MKFLHAGVLVVLTAGITASQSASQTTPSVPAPTPSQPAGKVIFSRSIDENGQTVTQSTQPEAHPAEGANAQLAPPQLVAAPTADDAERQALTFTDFDLDVHLRPADHHIAVRALVTVRNDSKSPLAHIPLQISSSLNWERIRDSRHYLTFPVATLNSDADHTGQLHEATVLLNQPGSQPLAPGSTLQLDVTYSGSIPANAQRLLTIGTPDDVALHSDWDEISPDFTGLRGFGNVVWYPVSSVPVILGDGARLFDEIGQHKLRLVGARFRLRLTVEFPRGEAPTVALINGHPATLTVTQPSSQNPDRTQPQEETGVATADNGGETLTFDAPSLFVAIRTPHPAANTTLWALPEHTSAIEAWSAAAATVTPFLQGWLGQKPRSQLTLLDLPDPQDAPYETGALLVTAIRAPNPEAGPESDPAQPNPAQAQLEGILAHALTHAWMQSPRAWLSEGVAHFMGTLWIEKQSSRNQALESLEAARPALALAEPESPGQSQGQPLDQAISPVYYRTKATYVFWMLRSVAGDPTLSAALRAYDPQADHPPAYTAPASTTPTNVSASGASPTDPNAATASNTSPSPSSANASASASSTFEKLLEQAGNRADLSWFFADWVNADKGLPDLSIAEVFPAPEQAGNWLVTVNIANAGYASAEVPVTVRSATNSVTQRVIVQARGKASPHLLIQGKPTQVQVNDGTIPETQATIHIKKLESEAPN